MRMTTHTRCKIMQKAQETLFSAECKETADILAGISDTVAEHNRQTHSVICNKLGIPAGSLVDLPTPAGRRISEVSYLRHSDMGDRSYYGNVPTNCYLYIYQHETVKWYGDRIGQELDLTQFDSAIARLVEIYKEVQEACDAIRVTLDGAGTLKSLLKRAPSFDRLIDPDLKRQMAQSERKEKEKAEERKRVAAERRKAKLIAEQMAEINDEKAEVAGDPLTSRIATAAFKGDL